MSVFDNDNKHVKHPPEILEFIIERIKLRKTQKRIIQNVNIPVYQSWDPSNFWRL